MTRVRVARSASSSPPAPGRVRAAGALAAIIAAGALGACAGDSGGLDPATPPAAAVVTAVEPAVVIPGSVLVLRGRNFSGAASHVMVLTGTREARAAAGREVSLERTLRVVDVQRAELDLDSAAMDKLGGEGRLAARIAIRSSNRYGQTTGAERDVKLELKRHLTPTLDDVGDGLIHLDSRVVIRASGLLLGGNEGTTRAILEGCFLPAGTPGPCKDSGSAVKVEVPLLAPPAGSTDRSRGELAFSPALVGIHPGSLQGTLRLANVHGDGSRRLSASRSVSFQLQRTRVDSLDPAGTALGQYLDVRGRGFIGGQGSTAIRFQGSFEPATGGGARQVTFDMVMSVVDGTHARHVLEEQQGIGKVVDLRKEHGTLTGTWTPTVYWQGDALTGSAVSAVVTVAPVKQLVWVRFSSSWKQGLKRFGLLAADARVRSRVLAVMRREYRGINVALQETEPKDFKLYAKLDFGGADPNGLGLMGYDNTPGKDVDNKRLYDWLGGVNALTQQDGYPGYGGVFIESLLGLSESPPSGIYRSPLHSPLFDKIFDPVRPDRGEAASTAEVLAAPVLTTTAGCPTETSRARRVACAIHVLGNVVGSIAAHELGHSLGLAAPYGSPTQFHNVGDRPNRLMDAGGSRPFDERAELYGKGPAVFCQQEYAYLKTILPLHPPADPPVKRPPCD